LVSTGITFTNAANDTIARSSGDWVADGYVAGRKIKVTGASNPANNGIWSVKSLTTSTLTLTSSGSLANESAGATVTITSYRRTLTRLPVFGTEQDLSVTYNQADGDVSIGNFATVALVPGASEIPAGIWNFTGYFWVDNAGGTNTIKYVIRKCTEATGETTTLYTSSASTVTATSNATAQKITTTLAVPATALLTTDRIVIRVVAAYTGAGNRTTHFVYDGTTRPSYLDSTFNVTAPSGTSGTSGYSGQSGLGFSGPAGPSGPSGASGTSGTSGASGASATSGTSGRSGYSGLGLSGYSGISGWTGISGISTSGASGTSAWSGATGASGFSGFDAQAGYSGPSGWSGISGFSGSLSGTSGYSGVALNPTCSENILDNGGMQVCQRPTYFASRTDDLYFIDRWNVLTQTAAVTCSQNASLDRPSGYSNKVLQPQASAQRFGISQILESKMSLPSRGKNMRLSFDVYHDVGSAKNIRYALLWWTGTANTVTSDVVQDWTSGTYTTSGFFKSTTQTLAFCDVAAVNDSTWTTVTRDITAAEMGSATDTSNKNLILMIWTEGTFAQNKSLFITSVDLFQGTQARDFQPKHYQTELAKCQRYYVCYQDLDGTRVNFGMGAFYATNTLHWVTYFPVPMRVMPTTTISVTSMACYADSLRTITGVTYGSGQGIGPAPQDFPTMRCSGGATGPNYAAAMVYTNGGGYVELDAVM